LKTRSPKLNYVTASHFFLLHEAVGLLLTIFMRFNETRKSWMAVLSPKSLIINVLFNRMNHD